MRFAVFSKIPLFPTSGGNRARILAMIDALERRGIDIVFVLVPSRQMRDFDRGAHERKFGPERFKIISQTRLERLGSNLKIILQRIRFRRGRKSTSVDYLFPLLTRSHVERALDLGSLDAAIVEYVHFSRILTFLPDTVVRIIDTHDSFASEFEEDAEAGGLRRAHLVLAIQDLEAERFARLAGPQTTVLTISHLIGENTALDVRATCGATFLGSNFAANAASLLWFVDRVLPLVLAQEPAFTLSVVGSVGRVVPEHGSIVVRGRVGALAEAFASHPILVNAIVAGTGIKIKLLDALSLGVPVVSTALGVSGIDPDTLDGVTVVEDGDAQRFADRLVALYRDADLRVGQGRHAHACARRWKASQEANLSAMLRLIATRPHRTADRGG